MIKPMSRRALWLFFGVAALLFISALLKQGEFQQPKHISPLLSQEPLQERVEQSMFLAPWKGKEYIVNPMYDYDLYGIVVSKRDHGWRSLERDSLNVSDLCVVWGRTAQSPHIEDVSFRNGSFTCFYRPLTREASYLDWKQLSNNHLITNNEAVRKQIMKADIGDQIYVKGWLAEYGVAGQKYRSSSVVRTDTGNGACETIFVNHFSILKKGKNLWGLVMWVTLILMVAVFLALPLFPKRFETQ